MSCVWVGLVNNCVCVCVCVLLFPSPSFIGQGEFGEVYQGMAVDILGF